MKVQSVYFLQPTRANISLDNFCVKNFAQSDLSPCKIKLNATVVAGTDYEIFQQINFLLCPLYGYNQMYVDAASIVVSM